jgi:hypothetical protein
MSVNTQHLFDSVPGGDPLHFWANHGLNYSRVTEFLDLDTNALSKLAGVSKSSVRFDERIPRGLKDRMEQIAIICSLVAEYFEGDVEKTALWFRAINPMLGNISPRDMIRLGRYKKLQKFIVSAKTSYAPPKS